MGTRHRRIDPAVKRQLDVAAAVASEELLTLHTQRALELVELARDRVTAPRMLMIYTRVHLLDEATAQAVVTRALAVLGQRAAEAGALVQAYREDEEDEALGESRSLLRVLRDRLRGRVHHDLRGWVEMHAGEVQMAVLDLHTTHALRFLQVLGDEHGTLAAVDSYVRMLGVRETQRTVLYHSVLARLALTEMPRSKAHSDGRGKAPVPVLSPDAQRGARRAV
jgi:hypothetical protein